MKLIALMGLSLGISVAYADQTSVPPAFRTDPSKPIPVIQVAPQQADTAPVSPDTNNRWKLYDSPLRECIQGDSIIPSSGSDLFSYLFHNNAQVDITMSIQGWKKKECWVNFSEATNVQYCQFNSHELQNLMKAILNSDKFETTSSFAQTLSTNCSPTAPTTP